MQKISIVIYRALYSFVVVATCLYAVGFMGNLIVPKSIDSGIRGPLTKSLSIDFGLLASLTIMHVVTRGLWFTGYWNRFVPKPFRQSAYVLLSCVALLVLFRNWRPMPEVIWNTENSENRLFIWILFGLGWVAALLGTSLTNKINRVGFRPHWILVFGLIVASWTTPRMTLGHALFASVATTWLVLACRAQSQGSDDSYVYANHHIPIPEP